METNNTPLISICIPHWQVKKLITICLRSIRKYSKKYNLEVIVVDNGSKDESLDYLRNLKWIKLLERPEETNDNFPDNVFSAWEFAVPVAKGKYFVVMHSDVFVKDKDWLDPYLKLIESNEEIAGVGTYKLIKENPIYAFQKHYLGLITNQIKKLWKRGKVNLSRDAHPRDYCAMYRIDVLKKYNIQFGDGGYKTAKQIWNYGYKTAMIPLNVMMKKIFHIAHATAVIGQGKPLRHKRKQKQIENVMKNLFEQKWIKDLENDSTLDN